MRFRTILPTFVVLLLATIAISQTKISGISTCAKPDQQQRIDVGDKPGHAFAISQGKRSSRPAARSRNCVATR